MICIAAARVVACVWQRGGPFHVAIAPSTSDGMSTNLSSSLRNGLYFIDGENGVLLALCARPSGSARPPTS
jgi:hypothetical protein